MKFLLISILAFLLYSNFNNFLRISKKQPPFEKLDQCLSPFKKMINSNGYITYKSNSNSLENYYLTQFILAPIILDNNGNEDTILYIKDLKIKNNNDSIYLKNNKVVFAFKNDNFHAFLLIKK
jgi:uncharacterized protein YehS (DUF1456 family)